MATYYTEVIDLNWSLVYKVADVGEGAGDSGMGLWEPAPTTKSIFLKSVCPRPPSKITLFLPKQTDIDRTKSL